MIYTVETYPYSQIRKAENQPRPAGNPATKKARMYKNLVCAFDIETTRLADIEQSVMYIWQFQIEDKTIIGRTWEEFKTLCANICERLKDNEYMVIWVHNLAYEFQFLSGIYEFAPAEVFATNPRKVCKCTMHNHLEFRCSYHLTNMSLAKFLSNMGIEAQKISGFDYNKQRFSDTPLTENEMLYCINDVKGLVQAISKKMKLDHDTFYTIPLTSTGYVRRIAKHEMRGYRLKALANQLPDYPVFKLLHDAYRGGNTHANRYFVGVVLENENAVSSYDRSSSYPDVMCNRLFPISSWRAFDSLNTDYVLDFINRWEYAFIVRAQFFNIRLRDILDGFPYIPKSKCMFYSNFENDNGRCLSADFIEIALTDIDLKIILKQYDFDNCIFTEGYYNRYGTLPYKLTDLVKKLYHDKTNLKGVNGKEYEYMQAKALLNSVYGMTVQSPIKRTLIYNNGWSLDMSKSDEELLIDSYKKAFISYAYGVYTSAWARYELQCMIEVCGHDCVYTDTDSVKFVNSHDFTAYNNQCKTRSIQNAAFADDPKGITHYMGVAEYEGKYQRFITWGAKRYAYENDGKITTTIAGVSKKTGGAELLKAGGLEALKDGFTFYDAGGTEAVYNDENLGIVDYHGRKLDITKNVVIRPSTYTLGLTDEYLRILEHADTLKRE